MQKPLEKKSMIFLQRFYFRDLWDSPFFDVLFPDDKLLVAVVIRMA